MLKFIQDKSNCTGCTACYSGCPVQCITMERDNEGFIYPVASDKCIDCGKCFKLCPQNNIIIRNIGIKQRCFAAVSKSFSNWKASASGGAFGAICKAWGTQGTSYAGATWNGFNVEGCIVDEFSEIHRLQKSKYIFSELHHTFLGIFNRLREGKKVVFCGTPCQVAGLKNYLGKEYDNLLLVDLVCHGVGSPLIFKKCIEMMEKQLDKSIVSYSFRAKRNIFEMDHLTELRTNNDEIIYLKNDQYMQLFLKQLCLRPSCGKNCKYRTVERVGDITIADFKGLTDVFPELIGYKKNYSTIVINTSKGLTILNKLQDELEMHECKIEDICKYNPLFAKYTWFSEERNNFFSDFLKDNEFSQWVKPASVEKRNIKVRINEVLPICVRRVIQRVILSWKK